MPAVSVIVPARDAAATIGRTLAGLRAQRDVADYEVLVVDDGSRDDTAAMARSAAVVTAVLAGDGAGPAAARNLGARRAGADALAFLDADCEPTPGWLAAGLAALRTQDLVQGQVQPRPAPAAGPFDRTIDVGEAHGLFESANLFVRRPLFERLGGFESWLRPRRGLELGEDVLLGWRARRDGARTGFARDALVYHEVFPRSAGSYVVERARLRFFPAMAARIPELRGEFFWRRYFLDRRSARFDLALAAGALAVLRRRPGWALGALPYFAHTGRAARRSDRAWPLVAAVDAAADAVGFAALAYGSARHRALLL
jgi:glycosyltransferase involved in cell wall biosynthesis